MANFTVTILRIKKMIARSDPALCAVCDIQITFDVNTWIVIRDWRVIDQAGILRAKVPSRGFVSNGQQKFIKGISIPGDLFRPIEQAIIKAYCQYLEKGDFGNGNAE